ncbi:urea transporter 2 [Orussus abietinus]|uniref:urea transporter 2 n=1 Tax=Orussus abietinus TaxID=222816 RepID=UPI000C715C08|nr:urea transporter 2 [Orussus abietinus]
MKFDRKRWVPWTGDFALLRNYLATKSRPPWIPLKVLDAVLRGYGQIAFANNSISGLLIVSALAATSPGIFSASLGTALLGLVFSVVSGESADKIQNGLTVFNPVLIGAVTYAVMPEVSDGSEILRLLLTISCTLFSVYLVRSIGNDRIPPLTLPFNLTELMLLFTLRISEGLSGVAPATDDWAREKWRRSTIVIHVADFSFTPNEDLKSDPRRFRRGCIPDISFTDCRLQENATGGVTLDAANGTGDALDWGMVFRGVITSSSQLYAVDSVPAAAVVYLAILVFSPTGCAFAFLGALLANLIGLGLGVPREIIYSGVRGFNGLLTGAGLGGFFFVLRVQTAMATVIGIVFSTILEHIMIHVLGKVGLPAMSMPFVFTIWLFIGLRDSSSEVFPQPRNLSFHEKHRHEYLVYRRALKVNTVDTGSAVDISEGKAREEELDEIRSMKSCPSYRTSSGSR